MKDVIPLYHATVLIADDQPALVEILRDYLEAEGMRVLTATSGDEALRLAQAHPVDCLLLDVMMPGQDGFAVCRRLREQSDLPILFLSARREDVDKIRGLGLGADDYITKPFSPPEVVARVKAQIRRYRGSMQTGGSLLQFGQLRIDPAGCRVWLGEGELTLAAKEFELLLFLARHRGQLFSREQLYNRIWGDYGDPHTVTVHIGRLREKIEPTPGSPAYIRTVRGLGYRFEGEPA